MFNWLYKKRDFIYIPLILILAVYCVLLTVNNSKLKKQNEQSYYAQKCSSFAVQNANLSKGQIIFIGDSITDLCPLNDYYNELPLAVYNRGIGGDTIQGVIDRLQVSLFDLQPSTVVIMIGINDLNGGRTNDYIISKYSELLGFIKTNLPQTKVFCMSVLSLNDTLNNYVDWDISKNVAQIMELNSTLGPLVDRFGYTFVDLFFETSDANNFLIHSLSDDGIHLNHNGFEIWKTVLMKAMLSN